VVVRALRRALLLALLIAAPAQAQAPVPVTDLTKPPASYRLTGAQVEKIAAALPLVQRTRRRYPGSYPGVYTKGPTRWQVSYFSRDKPPKEIAQVLIDDTTGAVLEQWDGYKVAWTMARGYPGAFGRKVNSPWVWIPLCAIFFLAFARLRKPLSVRNLDLLVLLAFSVSLAYFNDAQIGISVPIAYPLMLYLLARMLWTGIRGGRGSLGLHLNAPTAVLAVGLVFLMGFRIGLNVTNSNVIDVGYAGVIGADRLVKGERLYGQFPKDNEHGDTYGPVNYMAYVPFEQALPWHGRWDDLPAAHAAAICFDVLCVALLFLIGRRVRGPDLGIALAFAWAAYPFTLFVMDTNSNDALVAVFVLAAILAAVNAPGRGVGAALAGMTKFAPLALGPLLAMHRPRRLVPFLVAFLGTVLVVCAPLVLNGEDLSTVWHRTIGYQSSRGSPFSVWGYPGGFGAHAQHIWQAFAALLAVGLAFVPRRRDTAGLAALCAAVLIALQLGVTHWFYLYLVWFFPLVMLALLAEAPARSRPLDAAAAHT
jgi:Glycosyltransferase family 87